MKKEIADKWVAALRSGKYKKGTGYLNKNNKFCCLGVLCEILEIPKKYISENKVFYGENGICSFLPSEALEMTHIGLSNYSLSGLSNFHTSQYALSRMNDSGMSFKEIADYIQQNWENI